MKESLNEVKSDEVDLWWSAVKAASQLKTILCFSYIAESYPILNFQEYCPCIISLKNS